MGADVAGPESPYLWRQDAIAWQFSLLAAMRKPHMFLLDALPERTR